jgi:hypothetical protein
MPESPALGTPSSALGTSSLTLYTLPSKKVCLFIFEAQFLSKNEANAL